MTRAPADTFHATACLICLRAGRNIKRCSKCKTAAYCSRGHQKSDWPRHKQMCAVLVEAHKRITYRCTTAEEWKEYRFAMHLAAQNTLNRDLSAQELFMTLFPRACAVCYEKEKLYDCESCLCVAYCSREHELAHAKLHEKYCRDLKISMLVDQFMHNYSTTDLKFRTQGKPLMPKRTLDIAMHLSYNVQCKEATNRLKDDDETLAAVVVTTTLIGFGLNILYALQVTKVSNIPKLVIHLVGASRLEFTTEWKVVTDIIKFYLNIGHICYYLIGPDVMNCDFVDEELDDCCVKYLGKLYHQVANNIEKPDLVAAFNCGLHEHETSPDDTWKQSVSCLIRHPHVPLMLTSYTQLEMARDKRKVLLPNGDVEVIVDQENPFRLLKPNRNWTCVPSPVYYDNNYIFICRTRG